MEAEVKAYFDDLPQNPEEACKVSSWTSPVEKNHGRIEKRTVTVAPVNWFEDKALWAGLNCFIRVRREVTANDKNTAFERFYISSLNKTPEEFGALIRGYWSIENQLHWRLDVIFGEDTSCARKDNSPLNLNVLRKIALRLLKQCDLGKRVSTKKKRYLAALTVSTLELLISEE